MSSAVTPKTTRKDTPLGAPKKSGRVPAEVDSTAVNADETAVNSGRQCAQDLATAASEGDGENPDDTEEDAENDVVINSMKTEKQRREEEEEAYMLTVEDPYVDDHPDTVYFEVKDGVHHPFIINAETGHREYIDGKTTQSVEGTCDDVPAVAAPSTNWCRQAVTASVSGTGLCPWFGAKCTHNGTCRHTVAGGLAEKRQYVKCPWFGDTCTYEGTCRHTVAGGDPRQKGRHLHQGGRHQPPSDDIRSSIQCNGKKCVGNGCPYKH